MTAKTRHSNPRMTPLWYWRQFEIEVKLMCVLLVVNVILCTLVALGLIL